VSLFAGGDQAVFPVGPEPFVYREEMRLRIDVVSGHAFVSEMP